LVRWYIVYKCQVFREEGIKMLLVISWSYRLNDVSFFMKSSNIWLFMLYLTWSNNLTAKQGDNYNVRSIKLKGAVTTTSCISKSKHFAAGTEKGIVIVSNLFCCLYKTPSAAVVATRRSHHRPRRLPGRDRTSIATPLHLSPHSTAASLAPSPAGCVGCRTANIAGVQVDFRWVLAHDFHFLWLSALV